MNLQNFFDSFLVLALGFVIFLTIGFYINYKRENKAKKNQKPLSATEGRFFTLHVHQKKEPK